MQAISSVSWIPDVHYSCILYIYIFLTCLVADLFTSADNMLYLKDGTMKLADFVSFFEAKKPFIPPQYSLADLTTFLVKFYFTGSGAFVRNPKDTSFTTGYYTLVQATRIAPGGLRVFGSGRHVECRVYLCRVALASTLFAGQRDGYFATGHNLHRLWDT